MRAPRARRGKIRNELFLGFAAVALIGSAVTYGIVLFSATNRFDSLVGQNDVDIAKSYAASLGAFYAERDGWSGVADYLSSDRSRPVNAGYDGEPRTVQEKHARGTTLPMVLMDADGDTVFNGLGDPEPRPGDEVPTRLKITEGEKVVADGKTVGYVFFKSMVRRSYNPEEEAFIASLRASIAVSVGLGLVMALLLSGLIASRFSRPISQLARAVRKVADGNLSARVTVTRGDEIGSLAEGFNGMADRLQSTELARQNLLADMAHELRTPVSVIQANLEMILDGLYAADEGRMRELYDETRILTGLISDLRSLSDLETGYAADAAETVDLVELAEESRSKFAAQLESGGITLRIESVTAAIVVSNADRLRQVLRNILVNALKYAPKGSTITVSVTLDGDRARTTVSDEGPGVSPESIGKIFDRFYRVDPSRNRESGGRGLGLAICKRIVESYGGTVEARNRDPHGLAVSFELPASPA